jgi:glyoxylase-like metal-dependent hydrolase (beta-lactamase superfamily II)
VIAVHTPGHVGNHVCYLIEEHGFLTTGDHLMNGSTVVIIPPKGSMKDYIESLQKLRDYPIKAMGPGHGDVISKPEEVVEWTIQHRLKREAKVVAAMSRDTALTVTELVPTVYDDVDIALHGIAALSLHAHLIKLQIEQRAEQLGDGWQLV